MSSPKGARARPRVALAALRGAFRRVLAVYFRDIEVTGALPLPSTGGRLFGANHVNGLVDPLLVLVHSPCPVSPVGKAPLWRIPVLRWLLEAVDAVPIVRRRDDPTKSAAANDAVFERVGSHLVGGGNILIFPEGTSHNEPHLVPMRSGAGRMLARARALGDRELTFQAVGLEFEARDIFRSRALLTYGPVRSVEDLAATLGAEPDDSTLAARVTERLRDDLAALVVEGSTWEERRLIARVAEMFAHEADDPTLATWNAIGQRVEDARAALATSAPEEHAAIASAIDAYYGALAANGLDDADLRGGPQARAGARARAALLLLVLPLAVVGVPLYFLPYQLPRLAARGATTDVVSTYKLASGLVVFPLWAAGLLAVAWLAFPWPWSAVGAIVALTSPFAALAWLDGAPAVQRSLRAAELDRTARAELCAQRDAIMTRLEAARAAFEGAA